MDTLNLLRHLPSRPDPEPEVYTAREVARMLRLNIGGTYSLIQKGLIPAIRMGGRWLIPKRRFHDWLDGLVDPPEPDIPPPGPARRSARPSETRTGRVWA
jgi:excisionase family DNA binding protein